MEQMENHVQYLTSIIKVMVRIMFGDNYFNSIFIFILATSSMGQMKWQTYFKVAPNKLKIISNPKT